MGDGPPPIETCVQASALANETRGATFLVFAGKSKSVSDFLIETAKNRSWVVATQSENSGIKTVVLRGALQMPYREIGGLIFSAQRNQLAVTFTTYPVICEVEENNAQKN